MLLYARFHKQAEHHVCTGKCSYLSAEYSKKDSCEAKFARKNFYICVHALRSFFCVPVVLKGSQN